MNKPARKFNTLLKMIKESNVSVPVLFFDMLYCRIKYNVKPKEYYIYKFDRKGKKYRQNFLSEKHRRKYLNTLNPKFARIITLDKFITHGIFRNVRIPCPELYMYYNPSLIADHSAVVAYNYDSALKILKQNNITSFTVKPAIGSLGFGVKVFTDIDYSDGASVRLKNHLGEYLLLSDILGERPLIFEEVIKQTEQFSRFNPSSVNAIRIITTRTPEGETDVLAAYILAGVKDTCISNSCHFAAFIDVETGIIKDAIESVKGKGRYKITAHPDTGEPLTGVKIENWEKIKAQTLHFQKSLPHINAAGWDIAVTPEGALAIEMNNHWQTTVLQHDENILLKDKLQKLYDLWKESGKSKRAQNENRFYY